MENFILIFALLLIGFTLGHFKIFPRSAAAGLNQFVIYISLPALIFANINKLTLSAELLVPVLLPWLMIALSAALVLLMGKIFSLSRKFIGGLLLVVPLGNTSFFGIPMVRAFFSESHIPYAILYDQFGSFLALATYGSVIIALYSGQNRISLPGVLKNVLTFPPFIAFSLALLTKGFYYPQPLIKVFEMAGATLVPVVMFAVGLQIKLYNPGKNLVPMLGGLSIKLLIAPLLALAVCLLLGLNGEAVKVSVFEAGMGPMITASALAISADFEPDAIASMTGLGLLLSCLTLPLIFFLL